MVSDAALKLSTNLDAPVEVVIAQPSSNFWTLEVLYTVNCTVERPGYEATA